MVPRKVAFFVWLAALGRILTMDNLCKKGIILPQSLGSTSPLKGTNIELIHEGENQALYIYRNQNLQKEPEYKQTMPL